VSGYASQKTLAGDGRLSGVGLHTGKPSSVVFRPTAPNSGIRFFRGGKPAVELSAGGSRTATKNLRCSRIGEGETSILTVEHLLAALRGMGLTNLDIDVEGPEVPGLDGSALPFVELFKEIGIVDQSESSGFYRITEPIFCYDDLKSIAIYPAEEFSVSYLLDYEHPELRGQKVDFCLSPEAFESQIAPARTFCTDKEAAELQKSGFGLGANAENTLVVREDGSHRATMRFADECARHKVLDILGDLTLLGFPVIGRVVGVRSGHTLNQKLAEAIRMQKETMAVMDVEQIKKVLPHREPFLFVDRIVEMTDKRIVGLKKLTGKEDFFKGHFPQKPVMPGVLMIEALAQVGGVLMLAQKDNQGKIAYLVSVNNARFRRVVSPGEELRLEVDVLKLKSKIGLIKAVAKVGEQTACEAEIMFSLAD
jgi:UDP-3-O-[3-hydroxymyristoyl] N-acetylglucosamine deacetylase / 3-hydroxyacyl-[acyl-carrier-protein] dehydratase